MANEDRKLTLSMEEAEKLLQHINGLCNIVAAQHAAAAVQILEQANQRSLEAEPKQQRRK